MTFGLLSILWFRNTVKIYLVEGVILQEVIRGNFRGSPSVEYANIPSKINNILKYTDYMKASFS